MPYESPSAGARWLERNLSQLSDHRFEWVGSNGDGIIVSGPLLGPLMDEARNLTGAESLDSSSDFAWAYIDGQDFEPYVLGRSLF